MDTGPGTPRGDKYSSNPSESSSQGAGGKNLVGSRPLISSAPSNSSTEAITSVTELQDTNNLAAVTGKQVKLSEVKVLAIVGPRLIAVGEQGKPIYIRLHEPMQNLSEGSKITVDGTVQGSEAAAQAVRELTGEGAHILSQQPLFVDAKTIRVSGY